MDGCRLAVREGYGEGGAISHRRRPQDQEPMNDADNFHCTFIDAIKRDVAFNRKAPQPHTKLIASALLQGERLKVLW